LWTKPKFRRNNIGGLQSKNSADFPPA